MNPIARVVAVAASLVSAAALVPDPAVAAGRGHSVSGAGGIGGRGPAAGSYRGGYNGARGYGGPRGYAGSHGYHGHRGYWRPGLFWGGVGLGLGFGAIGYYDGWYRPYAPYYDGYYYDPAQALVVGPGQAAAADAGAVRQGQPVPQAARAPDPIFYPKNGQSPAVTEGDRRDCNRWATTQDGAMADASIFQRATLACMEGRGYTVK